KSATRSSPAQWIAGECPPLESEGKKPAWFSNAGYITDIRRCVKRDFQTFWGGQHHAGPSQYVRPLRGPPTKPFRWLSRLAFRRCEAFDAHGRPYSRSPRQLRRRSGNLRSSLTCSKV